MMTDWLKDAIFYEIYPQSFADSNGDGIGDIRGIIGRLDYLQYLGYNAIWMNPCYDSSFFDAGYDVRDYFKVAPRYGTNDDLRELIREVHARGMHILLDLVAGHTAIDHPWFKASCLDEQNEFTNRFIWRSGGHRGPSYPDIPAFLCGYSERPGAFAVNCFCTQPALNYGFGEVTENWQFAADSEEADRTRLLLQDIMSFWLDMGCDGFRVDMAGSLVKSDPGRVCTARLWKKVRAFMDERYPDAVLISEWGDPLQALKAGFHMDFLLHSGPTHYMDLFRTAPFFSAKYCTADGADLDANAGRAQKAGAEEVRADLSAFTACYTKLWNETHEHGLVCIPSGNHDMVRMREMLTPEEMKLAFAFLLTMPGCPFIYYGDEIGMRYVHGLKSKEGAYDRTGSRTPMQWTKGEGAGFSVAAGAAGAGLSGSAGGEDRRSCTSSISFMPDCSFVIEPDEVTTGADPKDFYLPLDPLDDRPDVESQMSDPGSLLQFVRDMITFRKEHDALQADGGFRFLTDGHVAPLVYERYDTAKNGEGERLVLAFNPSGTTVKYALRGDAAVVKGDAAAVNGDTAVVRGDASMVSGNASMVSGDAATAPGSVAPDSSAFCLIREYGGSYLDASGILTLPSGSFACVQYKSK